MYENLQFEIHLYQPHTWPVDHPDLELEGGRGGVLIFLPCWPFSLQSILLFLPKIRGGGHPGLTPRSAADGIHQS